MATAYAQAKPDGIPAGGRLSQYYAFWLGELLGLKGEILERAALGSVLGSLYVVLQDHTIDSRDRADPGVEVLSTILLSAAIETFHSIVPARPEFWRYLRASLREYANACLWEASLRDEGGSVSIADYFANAAGRSAPVKICVAALALAAGKEEQIENLCGAVDSVIIGLQIRDDLTDMEQDVMDGRSTVVIQLARAQFLRMAHEKARTVNIESLQNALLLTDLVGDLLRASIEAFETAKAKTAHLPHNSLHRFLDTLIRRNENDAARIEAAKIEYLEEIGLGKEYSLEDFIGEVRPSLSDVGGEDTILGWKQ